MPRIQPLDPATATEPVKPMLDGVQQKLGTVPNLLQTLAHAPAALQMYLGDSQALASTSLSAAQREQIALAVAETNGCHYCLSAHTLIGKGAGLDDDAIAAARRGEASAAKDAAMLELARAIVEKRAWIGDEGVAKAREAGLSDAEIIEVIAVVVHNLFTNYMNHILDPEIDFPKVAPPASVPA
ncbi:MAG: carboxymuconolactone decarboxylase family protein [Opitutales bacterium]